MIFYVLTSQGIEIYRTTDKNEAFNIMEKENEEWMNYRQTCIDNYEPCSDNEIFMHEEEVK
jgi:hypothetical protein